MITKTDAIQISENCHAVAIPLAKMFRINSPNGRQIRANSGEVLITQTNNFLDIVLKPGETFVPTQKGLVLIEAITEAHITIEMPMLKSHDSLSDSCKKSTDNYKKQQKNTDSRPIGLDDFWQITRV